MIPWSVHSALRVFFKLMISNSTSIRPIPSLVSAASLSFSSSVKATWRNTLAMSTLKPVRCLGRDDEVGDTGGISGEGGQGEDATDSSVTRRFSQELKEDDGEENTPPELIKIEDNFIFIIRIVKIITLARIIFSDIKIL